MTNRYGSESFALEFRDLQATTLSIDTNGEYALLAGRKYLAVLNLQDKDASVDKLLVRVPYGGKYEISNTQWCKGDDQMSKNVAVASSQRCDIFELTDSAELRCAIRLKGHTRVITDLDWCSLHPSLLATSSFDSFVHIWDIRSRNSSTADKPQFSLSALDGASQVRWNRQTEDILASCDGGHVKIWDLRKPNTPSEFIAAHASKINGLEWANSETIITAAQDCTVKFSKLSQDNPNKSKGPILSLTAPVWRARPAPFGRGVVTQCVPILRRDSGLLSLWDWQRFASPVFTFQAFDIIEFAWRKTQNFDLITWSRDQTLRVWTLPFEIVQLCGGDDYNMTTSHGDASFEDDIAEVTEEESSPPPTAESTPIPVVKNKRTSTLERRNRKSSSPGPSTRRDLLKAEFEKVEADKPENINFDQVELDKGLLRFSWTAKSGLDSKGRGITAGILASFPNGYPAAPPTFLVTNSSNEVDKNHVVKSLKNVAQQFSKKNEQSLVKCVEQFAILMNSIKTLEDVEQGYFPNIRGVSNVPFPRTSGARFCAVGMLVCFGRPSYLKKVKSNCDAGTPRALSALGPYLSQVALENEDFRFRKSQRRPEKRRAGLVTLFDVSPLLPFNQKLAQEYTHIVSSPLNRKSACDTNFAAAVAQNNLGVANVWKACSIIASFAHPPIKKGHTKITTRTIHDLSDDDEESVNWLAYHPLGCELIHSMISHFAQYGDVQTAASVAGVFTSHEHLPSPSSLASDIQHYKNITKSGHRQTVPGVGSSYHTVHGSDTMQIQHHLLASSFIADSFFRQQRSNSWSDSLDDIKQIMTQHEKHHNSSAHESHDNGVIMENGSSRSFYDVRSDSCELSKTTIASGNGILLDSNLHRYYDRYKKSYAEILYRWGLLQQRAQVLKNLTEISESNTITRMGVDSSMLCKTCGKSSKGPNCNTCRRIISICAICHTPAKGLSTFCPLCGHGGHSMHMLEWFGHREMCPSGCGCNCVSEYNRMRMASS